MLGKRVLFPRVTVDYSIIITTTPLLSSCLIHAYCKLYGAFTPPFGTAASDHYPQAGFGRGLDRPITRHQPRGNMSLSRAVLTYSGVLVTSGGSGSVQQSCNDAHPSPPLFTMDGWMDGWMGGWMDFRGFDSN